MGLYHRLWVVLLDCSMLTVVAGSIERFVCSNLVDLRLELHSIAGNRLHSLHQSTRLVPIHSVVVTSTRERHLHKLLSLLKIGHMRFNSGSKGHEHSG